MVTNRLFMVIVLFAAAALFPRSVDAIAQPPAPSAPPAVAQSGTATGQAPSTTSRPAKLIQDRRVKRWAKAFSWAVILLLIFAFAAIALVVFSRRFKDYLIRPARKPTEYVDAWQLYKLPPDADQEERDTSDHDDDN